MDKSSGVGVLDKAAAVLTALASGSASLSELVDQTGLPRPTAHRLARALEHHRLVARDGKGRFVLGPRVDELAAAAGEDRLVALAAPVLAALRAASGESTQLYRRQGEYRMCIASADRGAGLRDTVPVGARLSMEAGSAAQVLIAWEDVRQVDRVLATSRFTAGDLAQVRKRGWAQSIAEREAGVASVSAPVRGPDHQVVAALSISGPINRLTRSPGNSLAPHVLAASRHLSAELKRPRGSS